VITAWLTAAMLETPAQANMAAKQHWRRAVFNEGVMGASS